MFELIMYQDKKSEWVESSRHIVSEKHARFILKVMLSEDEARYLRGDNVIFKYVIMPYFEGGKYRG